MSKHLRHINRRIVSLIIFSADGRMLMGRKDPKKGGVYPDAWHIPGGGMEEGEDLIDTAIREGQQEVDGLRLTKDMLFQLPLTGNGETTKTLESGEKVWCKMEFNYFEVHLDQAASELAKKLKPGDDLVELRWFDRAELSDIQQIPGGKEFFIEARYIDR